jgi:uncharacterized protein
MSSTRPLAAVTGASAGLGATFARKLAARGYDLLLIARRRDRLEQLAAELPVHCEVVEADLTQDDQLGMVAARLREASNLELLVNNAGFGTMGKFFEVPLAGPDAMHRLHIMAIMRLTHAALPGMVARRKGGIVNVSSVAAFWRMPGSTSYCATKNWINAFSECVYLELKQERSPVRMQALCPGFTYTEFHDVANMDRNLVPNGWWMSANYVVEESLKALEKNKLFVVPALKYKALVWFHELLPRFCRHWLVMKIPRRRPKQ